MKTICQFIRSRSEIFLILFLLMNFGFLEHTYRKIA